ncbi:MAG TPA: STAS domain-containing protein [Armatimonadota bacterium]|nr:STAS domain-containing protein [Armatimonadota bacterium]
MRFALDVQYRGNASIVRVLGDLDVYTAPDLDTCLQQLITAGGTHLAVDLEKCSYLDSEGIKVLIRARESAGERVRLSICGAKGTVLRIFRISGLDTVFNMLSSTDGLPGD